MKPISSLFVIISILISSANAQSEFAFQNGKVHPQHTDVLKVENVKKYADAGSGSFLSIDPSILKAFSLAFPTVTKANWYEDASRYTVTFTMQQIPTTAIYDKAGQLIKIRRSYSKDFLSLPLLLSIHKKYPGKQVHLITEITNAEGTFYEITLNDQNYWYKLIADNSGGMDLAQKFRRGE